MEISLPRGLVMRPVTPSQLEDAGKVLTFIGVASATVLKCWKPVRTRFQAWQARREAAKAERAKAALHGVMVELRAQLMEAHSEGEKRMLDTVAGLRDLMGDHTLSDNQQFTELREQARGLRENQVLMQSGQEHTHETLAEMMVAFQKRGEKVEAIADSVNRIQGALDVILRNGGK